MNERVITNLIRKIKGNSLVFLIANILQSIFYKNNEIKKILSYLYSLSVKKSSKKIW